MSYVTRSRNRFLNEVSVSRCWWTQVSEAMYLTEHVQKILTSVSSPLLIILGLQHMNKYGIYERSHQSEGSTLPADPCFFSAVLCISLLDNWPLVLFTSCFAKPASKQWWPCRSVFLMWWRTVHGEKKKPAASHLTCQLSWRSPQLNSD